MVWQFSGQRPETVVRQFPAHVRLGGWAGSRGSHTTHSAKHCLLAAPAVCAQVSDKMDPAQLVSLIASLNPENVPGRLAVIVRMGAEKLRQKFPALIEAVEQAGQVGGWVLVHMHAEHVSKDCSKAIEACRGTHA